MTRQNLLLAFIAFRGYKVSVPRLFRCLPPSEPSNAIAQGWLRAVNDHFGHEITAQMLSVSPTALDGWLSRRVSPSKGTKKAIWLLWSLTFEPSNLRTTLDVMTWGKWSKRKPSAGDPVDDWSI